MGGRAGRGWRSPGEKRVSPARSEGKARGISRFSIGTGAALAAGRRRRWGWDLPALGSAIGGDGNSWRIAGERFAPDARARAAFFLARGEGGCPVKVRIRTRPGENGEGGISGWRRGSSRWGAICLGSPADPVVGVGGPARANWGALPHLEPRNPPFTAGPIASTRDRGASPPTITSPADRPHSSAKPLRPDGGLLSAPKTPSTPAKGLSARERRAKPRSRALPPHESSAKHSREASRLSRSRHSPPERTSRPAAFPQCPPEGTFRPTNFPNALSRGRSAPPIVRNALPRGHIAPPMVPLALSEGHSAPPIF